MSFKERYKYSNKSWIKTKRATKWKEGDNYLELWYHDTPVVRLEETERGDIITLNTGGYKTVTTKARINDFFRYTYVSMQLSHMSMKLSNMCNYTVYQEDFTWYVAKHNVWYLTDPEEWAGDTFVIDMRVPEPIDESTHEEITKTMN